MPSAAAHPEYGKNQHRVSLLVVWQPQSMHALAVRCEGVRFLLCISTFDPFNSTPCMRVQVGHRERSDWTIPAKQA